MTDGLSGFRTVDPHVPVQATGRRGRSGTPALRRGSTNYPRAPAMTSQLRSFAASQLRETRKVRHAFWFAVAV